MIPRPTPGPVSNKRVFVLTPSVEIMEYACMEGNLTSLLEKSITPWTGPQDHDANLVYGTDRDWDGYDQSNRKNITGVIRTARFNREPYGVITLEADWKTWTVILGPPVRMDFCDLTETMLRPGVTASVEGFVNRRLPQELRTETLALGQRTYDLR